MASMEGLGTLSTLSAGSLRQVLDRGILAERLHCVASSSTHLLLQVLGGVVKLSLDLRLVKLAVRWGEWLQHADDLQLELEHSWSPAEVVGAASLLALLLPGPNNGVSALVIKGVSALHGAQDLATLSLSPLGQDLKNWSCVAL